MSVELTIDGTRVTGKKGQTILEVAQENRIHIPTLCHHPLLPTNGACRICVVDIGRKDRLEAACTTPITNDMKVETKSKRVLDARRLNLELLLSNHRADCVTCEQDGQCILQDLAYELELDLHKTAFKPQDIDKPVDDSSPAILYDPNMCVLCGRCISACNNIRHHNVLSYKNRGYDTLVIAGLGELFTDSDCVNCGECIQVCPTKAISIPWESVKSEEFQERLVEYAFGIWKERKGSIFAINFLHSLSPDCDCLSKPAPPLAPDIGIVAGKNIVEVEEFSLKKTIEVKGYHAPEGVDKFLHHRPNIPTHIQMEYGKKLFTPL